MTKNNKRFYLVGVLGLLLIVGVVLLVRKDSAANDPPSNPTMGFQYYKPSYMPPGTAISAERIDIASSNGEIHSITADMNLRKDHNWEYAINEMRADLAQEVVTSKGDYDPKSTGKTCTDRKTEAGQTYQLCHRVDYGKINVFYVKFTKDNTYIEADFPVTMSQTLELKDLDRFANSFKPAAPPQEVVEGI